MIRRHPMSVFASMAVIAASLFFVAGPAQAQDGSCSGLDRAGTECSIIDVLRPGAPVPGGPPVLRSSSPPGPTFVWLNLLLTCDAATSSGWTSLTNLASAIFDISLLAGAGPPADPGVVWIGELIDPVTGGTNTGYLSCVGTGDAPPPLPPPLPTAGEIWGEALTFEPSVNLDPYVRGLTGLETFMWYEGPTSDSVALILNGYAVTAQIDAVEFSWDTGGLSRDGVQLYVSATPGSADDPAADHIYAQPEDVVVIHEIVWTGTGRGGPGPAYPPAGRQSTSVRPCWLLLATTT